MRIYFAGSIRGGRQDADLYAAIIRRLKKYGPVLTEHVGHEGIELSERGDRAIHDRDMEWLEEADLLVAEVTVPSHGVGYEIARGETLGKPILCLHRPGAGSRPSALISGSPAVRFEQYERLDQLDAIINQFFEVAAGRTVKEK